MRRLPFNDYREHPITDKDNNRIYADATIIASRRGTPMKVIVKLKENVLTNCFYYECSSIDYQLTDISKMRLTECFNMLKELYDSQNI